MGLVRITAESVIPKYQPELEDYYIEFTGRVLPAAVTAQSGTGAWSLYGETGSALTIYPASGLSASAVAMTHYWSAWNSGSGAGGTGTGSASALYSLRATFRLSGGSASGAPGLFTCSAELRTSSGRYLVERFTIKVGA